jgi:hypothetical protein
MMSRKAARLVSRPIESSARATSGACTACAMASRKTPTTMRGRYANGAGTRRFQAVVWRDDSQTTLDWFKATLAGTPPSGPGLNLGVVLGPDFLAMTANLARNIREYRLGVLSAVLTRGM